MLGKDDLAGEATAEAGEGFANLASGEVHRRIAGHLQGMCRYFLHHNYGADKGELWYGGEDFGSFAMNEMDRRQRMGSHSSSALLPECPNDQDDEREARTSEENEGSDHEEDHVWF